MFNAWIGGSNFVRTPSSSFGCWDEVIVETGSTRREKRVWDADGRQAEESRAGRRFTSFVLDRPHSSERFRHQNLHLTRSARLACRRILACLDPASSFSVEW
jgi:hypothetical protein